MGLAGSRIGSVLFEQQIHKPGTVWSSAGNVLSGFSDCEFSNTWLPVEFMARVGSRWLMLALVGL